MSSEQAKTKDLSERLLVLGVNIIKSMNKMPLNSVGKYIGNQLMRSGTSAGANYEEACGAESRSDFIHKMGLVLKELKETRYWLRLIKRTDLLKTPDVDILLNESAELCAVIAKGILTAKKSRKF